MTSRTEYPGSINRDTPLPRASVIVPTYARPSEIQSCVGALLRLRYPKDALEIIVVDDGSPEEVDLSGLRTEHTLKVLRIPNEGPASARNRGAEEATGEILAFTDDDCRPEEGWLLTLVEALEEYPRSLVGGRTVNALGENAFSEAGQDLLDFLYSAFERSRSLLPFFTTNNLALRRDLFFQIGGFDPSFRFSAGEDRDLCERWSQEIGSLLILEEARVHHYHDLRFLRFLRQHFHYGRGAVQLARCRRARGQRRPRPEPLSFYARMLKHPLRRHSFGPGLKIAALVALSQLTAIVGMAVELLRPSASESTRRPSSFYSSSS